MAMVSRMYTLVATMAFAAAGTGSDHRTVADDVCMLQMTQASKSRVSNHLSNRTCIGGNDHDDDCIKPELCGLGFTVYPYIQPQLWGHSYEGWEKCAGQSQSPINLENATRQTGRLRENYQRAKNLRVLNDGHSLKVRGLFGTLRVGCCEIPSIQFHFHTPSEHQVNGKPYDMEMHIVHSGGAGGTAVVGIFFKVGSVENQCLKSVFWAPAPRAGCDKFIGDIDISCFFDKQWDGQFFQYTGSLTTPPCTEGVQWYVRKTPIIISRAQLDVLQTRYIMNARPVQPLNGRSLHLNTPSRNSPGKHGDDELIVE